MIACPSQSIHNHHKTTLLLCDICTYKKRKFDEERVLVAKVDSAEIVTVQGTLSLVVE